MKDKPHNISRLAFNQKTTPLRMVFDRFDAPALIGKFVAVGNDPQAREFVYVIHNDADEFNRKCDALEDRGVELVIIDFSEATLEVVREALGAPAKPNLENDGLFAFMSAMLAQAERR